MTETIIIYAPLLFWLVMLIGLTQLSKFEKGVSKTISQKKKEFSLLPYRFCSNGFFLCLGLVYIFGLFTDFSIEDLIFGAALTAHSSMQFRKYFADFKKQMQKMDFNNSV